MYSLGLLAFSSFILALLLTPLVRNLARRFGFMDHSLGERRLHADPIPRLGGIAMVLAYIGAFAILLLADLKGGRLISEGFSMVTRLMPAAALIFAIGILDDLRGLSPLQKFAGQLVAALLAIWGGVLVTGVIGWNFPVWMGVPVTVIWLVGCTNAFNLIDGMDGLATGMGLFATMTILLVALFYNDVTLALAVAPLMGALLGFLRFNFNPATIFLGDCGSLTLGFLLGCYGVFWSQKAATLLGMTAPMMVLAVPLLDTTLSIVRRFLLGKPIYKADRGHIHHRLLARGMTQCKVVLLLYGVAACGALLSVLLGVLENQYSGLVVVIFCGAAWIGVQHLGYMEFGLARRMFSNGDFRPQLHNQLVVLRRLDTELKATRHPSDCWRVICRACTELGFNKVEMQLDDGTGFQETLVETQGLPMWTIHVPLNERGWLRLGRGFDASGTPTEVAALANLLHSGMQSLDNKPGKAGLAGRGVSNVRIS